MFGIVATVIKIGNLRIERASGNSQTSFLVRDEIAMAVASGVGMTLDELEECLCTQVTRAKKKGVDPTTACERRDAFAAALYERTVLWLLRRINAVFEREALDTGIDAVESASHGPVRIVFPSRDEHSEMHQFVWCSCALCADFIHEMFRFQLRRATPAMEAANYVRNGDVKHSAILPFSTFWALRPTAARLGALQLLLRAQTTLRSCW